MENVLRELGLTDSEIKVYLAMCKLGTAPASAISEQAGLYRTNAYDILEKLTHKGLVNNIVRNNVKFYGITKPGNLKLLLEEKKNEILETEKELNHLIKDLKTSRLPPKKQRIFVYQDHEGLSLFYEQLVAIARSRDEVQVIASSGLILNVLNYYMLNLSKRIKNINVRGKMIANKGIVKSAIMRRVLGLVDLELRFLPKGRVSPVAVFVFKSNVGFCNFRENPFVILIDDKALSESYRQYFEELWGMART